LIRFHTKKYVSFPAHQTTCDVNISSASKNDLIFSIGDNTGDYIEIKNTEEGGGCLIATAAFGSEMSPQVQFLREIRDNTVLQTESGTSFMTGFNQFYYSFSPAIADYERENLVFKETVKLMLTPLLTSLTLLHYADIDSESEMLGYGIRCHIAKHWNVLCCASRSDNDS